MPIVHTAKGRFFDVPAKELKQPVRIVCDGNGKFYVVSPNALKREVKTEKLPAHLQAPARAGSTPRATGTQDLIGQPMIQHCAVCSVRG